MVDAKKVVVAMSGGVDSSVAAALLVEQGYDVAGVMLKLWSDSCGESENACCPPEAIAQAREVASVLGIPFYVLDTQDIFKKQIVDRFVESYRLGMTPNPCFDCNRMIRWGTLLGFALENGYEFMATGHYARLKREDSGLTHLLKGVDETKDQSYVLSGLVQSQLAHTLLPLGELKKTQVRELARSKGLPVAEKHDSQDLCFVGDAGYRDFVRRHSPVTFMPGEIVNSRGMHMGMHAGLENYTIGQRKGLGAGNAQPLYVMQKDVNKNRLIVGTRSELGRSVFDVRQLHCLSEGLKPDVEYKVKIRYRSTPMDCHVVLQEDSSLQVLLQQPAMDVTAGQIAVFYQGDEVMASGMIC
jgi:tRNA-specific 2-thiouridylase